ncbi:hypothetical protein GOV11_02275 [Candidatus Woesearchaeota archaeon]|nr:hypothetical protein [Candidatus Woesearchaeota archaeon]
MVMLPGLFGPSGMFSNFFLSPDKIPLVLAFVIPLIILYLIKPRPTNVTIPSLMFILKDVGKSTVHRFFRSIFNDILFLLQLLAILLLAMAIAKPFFEVSQESLVQQSIIVIDVSASTNAEDRWDEIQDLAIDSLAGENVIILARKGPIVLEEGGQDRLSTGDAKNLIQDLEPSDMQGDLPTALTLAEQYTGTETKVTVISDMVLSLIETPQLIEAKLKILRSKGALVEIKTVEAGGENVGIIDAQLNTNDATIELKIQNFNDRLEEIKLEVNGKRIDLQQNILEKRGQPGSLLSVNVPLVHGMSEFELSPKDDFMIDNFYYVSIPTQESVSALMISNDDKVHRSRLIPALKAAGDEFTEVVIQYAEPPKVPDLNHNLYILKDVNTQFVLPGVIKGIEQKVSEGAVAIIYAQPDLFNLDFKNILPVEYKSQAQPLAGRQELIVNGSLSLMRGLSDIGQADGDQLLRVKAKNDAIVYASVSTNDGPEPVIAAKRIGKGAVIYYGIRDKQTYDLDPQSYAIIWGRIVDFSLVDPMTLNLPTGAVIPVRGQNVKTPMGKLPGPVLMSKAGVYQLPDRTLVANLYGLSTSLKTSTEIVGVRSESAIASPVEIDIDDISSSGDGDEKTKVPKDLTNWLIILGLIVMLVELLYVKYRGDI